MGQVGVRCLERPSEHQQLHLLRFIYRECEQLCILLWSLGDGSGLERYFGVICTQMVFEAWELGLPGGWVQTAKGKCKHSFPMD